jgi:hypothetical protein
MRWYSGLAVLMSRSNRAKDAELLVLRRENNHKLHVLTQPSAETAIRTGADLDQYRVRRQACASQPINEFRPAACPACET